MFQWLENTLTSRAVSSWGGGAMSHKEKPKNNVPPRVSRLCFILSYQCEFLGSVPKSWNPGDSPDHNTVVDGLIIMFWVGARTINWLRVCLDLSMQPFYQLKGYIPSFFISNENFSWYLWYLLLYLCVGHSAVSGRGLPVPARVTQSTHATCSSQ